LKNLQAIWIAVFASGAICLLTAGQVSADDDHGRLRLLQQQINAISAQLSALQAQSGGLQIIFRDAQGDAVLNPGERLTVVASCKDGEVVVSGGFNFNPNDILRVTLSSPFFDGVHSGWLVDFLNAGGTTAAVTTRVISECTKGTGIGQ